MNDTCTYQIMVGNSVDIFDLNEASPIQTWLVRGVSHGTLLFTKADQYALIGLLRYFHQRGFVLLSVIREPQTGERK